MGKKFVTKIRAARGFSEKFLQRYNLSNEEGIAVLVLAEGLLRIPDSKVSAELITDKLSNKNWEASLFKGSKSIKTIIASFGLYFSGKFTDIVKSKNTISKLLERVDQQIFVKILKATILALSKEFVFANDMHEALIRKTAFLQNKFAFDLLGELARTHKQAATYYQQYEDAIKLIAKDFPNTSEEIEDRPNISVKLTALHPRFELAKMQELEKVLLPKVVSLVEKMRDHNLTITFDAEEAFRTDAYLLFLTKLIKHTSFKEFNGIGFVVQAYKTNSMRALQYIIDLAKDMGEKNSNKISKRCILGFGN